MDNDPMQWVVIREPSAEEFVQLEHCEELELKK